MISQHRRRRARQRGDLRRRRRDVGSRREQGRRHVQHSRRDCRASCLRRRSAGRAGSHGRRRADLVQRQPTDRGDDSEPRGVRSRTGCTSSRRTARSSARTMVGQATASSTRGLRDRRRLPRSTPIDSSCSAPASPSPGTAGRHSRPCPGAVARSQFAAADLAAGAVFAFGNRSIFVSNERGSRWQRVKMPRRRSIADLDFVTKGVGYLLDTRGALWKTTDGGRRWRPVPGLGARASAVEFSSRLSGYAVVRGFGSLREAGIVMRTTDGGSSWHPQLVEPFLPGLTRERRLHRLHARER